MRAGVKETGIHTTTNAGTLPRPCTHLGTAVRLKANGSVTSDVAKVLVDLVEHLPVAGCLLRRHKGVHVGKFRPGHSLHLGGRGELHGARSEWDHGVDKRYVLVLGEGRREREKVRLALVQDERQPSGCEPLQAAYTRTSSFLQ